MGLSLRKSLQDVFVITDGFSAARVVETDQYIPVLSYEFIHALKHEKFIELCAGYFEEKGYRSQINNQTDNDLIDIWLFKESYSSTSPFGIVSCWKTKAIAVKESDLRPFSNVIENNKVPFGAFITAGKFSSSVTKNMDSKLKLIDGKKLYSLLGVLPEIRKQRLIENVQ